ncbi:MAG: DNA repair protein RecN [Clostridiales bacterium]|nr:DNA repair protein RecN [Clostridiales bacterium]
MLVQLHVKNLAVIREEDVCFHEGLNILTGETGAGKSILLGSIELMLGAKTDRTMIRKGAEYALAELTFAVKDKKTLEKLEEDEIFPEDGCIVLSRKLTESRSVSRINGMTVSASKMAQVAMMLFELHGQEDNFRLRQNKRQGEIIDAFAGEKVSELRNRVRRSFREYNRIRKKLDEMSLDRSERLRQLSLIRYEIEDIEKAAPVPGEDEELEKIFSRQQNARKIIVDLKEAYDLLSNERGAESEIDLALGKLEEAALLDEDISEIRDRISEVSELLTDAARSLNRYGDRLSFSEEELFETTQRLDEYNRLKDRYGRTVEEVLKYRDDRIEEEERLQNYEEIRNQLEIAAQKAYEQLKADTKRLTQERTLAAGEFSIALQKELAELNFASCEFKVNISPKEDYSEDGRDEIEFLISLNPGEPLRPLAVTASGGELSRVMLGIRTILANKDNVETVVFDEIDTGISGRTAQKVADKLTRIAANRQVLCITHLPQIAAMADSHYIINKDIVDGQSDTTVREADDEESILELARMLGGKEITETVIRSAREMKNFNTTH